MPRQLGAQLAARLSHPPASSPQTVQSTGSKTKSTLSLAHSIVSTPRSTINIQSTHSLTKSNLSTPALAQTNKAQQSPVLSTPRSAPNIVPRPAQTPAGLAITTQPKNSSAETRLSAGSRIPISPSLASKLSLTIPSNSKSPVQKVTLVPASRNGKNQGVTYRVVKAPNGAAFLVQDNAPQVKTSAVVTKGNPTMPRASGSVSTTVYFF